MLAVFERALVVLQPILAIEDRPAGFDDRDAEVGLQLNEALDQHRGGNAAADHTDV